VSLSVQLTRLIKAGVLTRAAQVWYENPFMQPSTEEVAMVIRYPSYLSLEYALSRHGLLSQTVFTLTLVTTKLPYTYHTSRAIYEYHQLKKSLFWGFQQDGSIWIAEPEKALLDLIYIRGISTRELPLEGVRSLVDDTEADRLNRDRLHNYARRFTPKTRRLLQQTGL
jgi:hypothetical protein